MRRRTQNIWAAVFLGIALHSQSITAQVPDPTLARSTAQELTPPEYQWRIAGAILLNPTASARMKTVALEALFRLGPEASPAGEGLLAALGDKSEDVHDLARRALERQGRLAAPWLLEGIKSDDARARNACARMLRNLGPAAGVSARDYLILYTAHASPQVRLAALTALDSVGRDSYVTLHAVIDLLEDLDPAVCLQAAESLARLQDMPNAVGAIVRALGETAPHRRQVLEELARPRLALQTLALRRVVDPLSPVSPGEMGFAPRHSPSNLSEDRMGWRQSLVGDLEQARILHEQRESEQAALALSGVLGSPELDVYETARRYLRRQKAIEATHRLFRGGRQIMADPAAAIVAGAEQLRASAAEAVEFTFATQRQAVEDLAHGDVEFRVYGVKMLAWMGPTAPDARELITQALRGGEEDGGRGAG